MQRKKYKRKIIININLHCYFLRRIFAFFHSYFDNQTRPHEKRNEESTKQKKKYRNEMKKEKKFANPLPTNEGSNEAGIKLLRTRI